MNEQWTKRLNIAGWTLILVAGLILLVAAVQNKNNNICKAVKVELSGSTNNFFIDEKEVTGLLNATGMLKGEKITNINLQLLEKRIENDTWIANAELYFDKDEVLNVKVEEREPVARVFTTGGNSFYLDSACKRLPVSDKVSVRVPMFTSFPSDTRRLKHKDSLLLASVKELALFIRGDAFWNAQVAQVDITDDRSFEMIPTLGNHVVKLGRPVDYDEKFARLYTFYKQVWTQVGLEKYSQVDVQFSGQIVATRRGEGTSAIDSLKAKEAFDKLMQDNRDMQREQPAATNASRIVSAKRPRKPDEENGTAEQTMKKSAERPVEENRKRDMQKPRAVMPKKTG